MDNHDEYLDDKFLCKIRIKQHSNLQPEISRLSLKLLRKFQ